MAFNAYGLNISLMNLYISEIMIVLLGNFGAIGTDKSAWMGESPFLYGGEYGPSRPVPFWEADLMCSLSAYH